MKSQIVVVSLVLVMIVSATLPGISLCLDSSVTSYNNNGLYNTGDIENIKNETEGVEFDVIDVSDDFGNEAYEIVSSDDSFGTGKVSFNIPESKTFIVNVKIDEYHLFNPSGFDITIDTGNGNPVTASNIYGGSVNSGVGKCAQGYLCRPGTNGNDNWHLETGTTHAEEFSSKNGDVSVTVTGAEKQSTIHFYIIFV